MTISHRYFSGMFGHGNGFGGQAGLNGDLKSHEYVSWIFSWGGPVRCLVCAVGLLIVFERSVARGPLHEVNGKFRLACLSGSDVAQAGDAPEKIVYSFTGGYLGLGCYHVIEKIRYTCL